MATRYIDCVGGADTNTGSTTGAPWKHAPGMVGCTSNCASSTPAAGDSIIFKGGITCGSGNWPMTWSWSGTVGSHITLGVDQSWFTGGSWARPIFNPGGMIGSTTGVNVVIDARPSDHVTINQIEFNGFTATNWAGTFGDCAVIEAVGMQDVIIDGIYVHGFSIDLTSDGNGCHIIQGATFAPYQGDSVVKNSVIAGDGASAGSGILAFGNVKNCVIHDMIGMIFPMGHGEISGNLLYNCGYPSFPAGASGTHADAIQVDGADGTFYIHDNVIHDTGADANGNECEAMLIGNDNIEVDYVWNNVLYNIHGNAMALVQNSLPGVAAYFWNNTITGGFDGTGYCVRAGHDTTGYSTIEIRNNHCITDAGRIDDPTLVATTLTVNSNTTQPLATASGQGYNSGQTYAYSPTLISNSTVGAGANLSSNCSGTNSGLCSDTAYAASVGAGNQIVYPTRTPVSRGSTWDTGAYMFTAGADGSIVFVTPAYDIISHKRQRKQVIKAAHEDWLRWPENVPFLPPFDPLNFPRDEEQHKPHIWFIPSTSSDSGQDTINFIILPPVGTWDQLAHGEQPPPGTIIITSPLPEDEFLGLPIANGPPPPPAVAVAGGRIYRLSALEKLQKI